MSQTVNINFRMDAELKKNMEKVCADMGLTMTTAFTIFAKKVSREKRIPFELSADPFYSESNIKYLEAIMEDVKSGKAHFAEHDLIEDD
ncbi:MAG: type II toxin-antitoxin system RelB/DinJ family antitoxin [Lachnospiraceae bacterium]|jgi:addiction module antitoxin, RelB/DinJ family